jgi:hypothetical protein
MFNVRRPLNPCNSEANIHADNDGAGEARLETGRVSDNALVIDIETPKGSRFSTGFCQIERPWLLGLMIPPRRKMSDRLAR